jgi:phenylpyruvate tautomerase PptA (4-oxalocrotonate tautomerase family)
MPLWKVYHPVGAYSAQDKKEFAEKVTAMYLVAYDLSVCIL